MSFDPYAELGADRGATPAELKSAYRKRAKKIHPDTGGDASGADFARLQKAWMVLRDPIAKKRFDETGTIEEPGPNNDRSAALQVLEAYIANAIATDLNHVLMGRTPPRMDLFNGFIASTREEIREIQAQIETGRKVRDYLLRFRSRIEGTDPGAPVERAMELRIADAENKMREMQHAIEIRKMAIEIAKTYKFLDAR